MFFYFKIFNTPSLLSCHYERKRSNPSSLLSLRAQAKQSLFSLVIASVSEAIPLPSCHCELKRSNPSSLLSLRAQAKQSLFPLVIASASEAIPLHSCHCERKRSNPSLRAIEIASRLPLSQ